MSVETPTVESSNQALLEEAVRLMKEARTADTRFISTLAQVAERRAYLGGGYSSLLAFCTEGLLLSRDEACARIAAARAILDFPIVRDWIEDGSLTQTNLCLLRPYLTPENHEAVLSDARYKTKREVQVQIGTLVSHVPLFPLRFDVPAETLEKLDRARDLLGHVVPDGNGAEILDRALTALIDQYEKRKFAVTDQPRTTIVEDIWGRYLPAALRRFVFKRDGRQCRFVGPDGRRCTARRALEFHHLTPYAVGGRLSAANIELRCRAHNRYEAEVYFGRPMADMIPNRERPEAPLPTRDPGEAPSRSGPT